MSQSFHHIPLFEKNYGRLGRSGHGHGLLHRTDTIRLSRATTLARAGMVAVAPAVGGLNVGERGSKSCSLHVDSVADSCTVLHRIDKNADYRAGGNVHDIV